MGKVIRLPDSNLRRRVLRGARLLDQAHPGWATRINLRRLGAYDHDVLVQLFGDHETAMNELGFASVEQLIESRITARSASSHPSESLADYGFMVYGGDFGGNIRGAFQELRKLWREEIKRRIGTD